MNMGLNLFPLLPHSHSHEHRHRGSALLLSGCPRTCSSRLPSNHLAEVARSATVLAMSVLARLMPSWPPVWSSVTPRARPRKALRLLWRQPWRRWASKSNTTPSARCEGYVTRTLPVLALAFAHTCLLLLPAIVRLSTCEPSIRHKPPRSPPSSETWCCLLPAHSCQHQRAPLMVDPCLAWRNWTSWTPRWHCAASCR